MGSGETDKTARADFGCGQGTIFWKIKEAREKGKGWNKGFGIKDALNMAQGKAKAFMM